MQKKASRARAGAEGPFIPVLRGVVYTTPKASIASATFLKPAMLAPFT